jgi:hypothetical protein
MKGYSQISTILMLRPEKARNLLIISELPPPAKSLIIKQLRACIIVI